MLVKRDYSVLGPENAAAVSKGLTNAKWYRCAVPRPLLKELMQRRDGPAIHDTVLWVLGFIVCAAGGTYFWGTWYCVPFFIGYGVLYGSSSDSRWHECGHGTAFKTFWMNNLVYKVACFMIMRDPECWRWSHTRHHTDTIIVGRDPEIAVQRPPVLWKVVLYFFGWPTAYVALKKLVIHSTGRMLPDEATWVPESEWPKVYRDARVFLTIHIAAVVVAFALRSWLPVLFIGPLPLMYGTWLSVWFGLTQHIGLAEDVLDHRLCSRTVYMNPLFRFLYWNMNYHVEHHMFPMVPYHALPKLHEAVKADTPIPCASTIDAYFNEIIPALIRQTTDPAYTVRRPLPQGATPYIATPYATASTPVVAVPAE
jgi:fatty acid desaturase